MDIILGKNGQTRDVIGHISSDRILLQLMHFLTESKLQSYLHLNYVYHWSNCSAHRKRMGRLTYRTPNRTQDWPRPPQAHGQPDTLIYGTTLLAPSTASTWTAISDPRRAFH